MFDADIHFVTEVDTTYNVQPRKLTSIAFYHQVVSYDDNTFVSIALKGAKGGCLSSYEFTLNAQESYLLLCTEDLTGTEVSRFTMYNK